MICNGSEYEKPKFQLEWHYYRSALGEWVFRSGHDGQVLAVPAESLAEIVAASLAQSGSFFVWVADEVFNPRVTSWETIDRAIQAWNRAVPPLVSP